MEVADSNTESNNSIDNASAVERTDSNTGVKSKHSMISASTRNLPRSKSNSNSKSLKSNEHNDISWATELEEKDSQSSIVDRIEIDSAVLIVNESTKSFRAQVSNDELQAVKAGLSEQDVDERTGNDISLIGNLRERERTEGTCSKSKHSMVNTSRQKLARSKPGSDSKSLKSIEHLDITWDTEPEEKDTQSSIVDRTEIDSAVLIVNESTKSFRSQASNDEFQAVKARFSEQDVDERIVNDISLIGNSKERERTGSKSKHSMDNVSREKLARSKTDSNSKSLISKQHLDITWDTALEEKDSQSSIVKRTEIEIDSTVLSVNESTKSFTAITSNDELQVIKPSSLVRKSLNEQDVDKRSVGDINLIGNSAMERTESTGSKSKSKHSMVDASREKLARSKTGSNSKSLISKQRIDITWDDALEEKDSQSSIVKRTEIEIDSTILNANESPKRLRATASNEEFQVIKATSLGHKMSVNDQDAGVRIVDGVTISVDGFGLITTDTNVEVIKRFTFTNKNQMQVQVITLGATVTKILVPDKHGVFEDIALGFDTCEDYLRESNPNIGCTLGRDAFETLQDEHYNGVGNLNWVPSLDEGKLILTHVSKDGWHGYRGTVMIRATFELRKDNSFHVTYWATTTINTTINLSLNLFLNLGGHAAKHNELYKHIFTINGDKSIQERTYRLSKFKAQSVGGTVYDLRIPKEIGPVIGRSPQHGFDKYYILTKGTEQTMAYAARVIHPNSGRTLEVYTDQDGIQFYTSDYFPDLSSIESIPVAESELSIEIDSNCESKSTNNSSKTVQSHRSSFYEINGKNGAKYGRHDAFCINSLNLPSEDVKNFQKNVLLPGRTYNHRIIYKFGVLKNK